MPKKANARHDAKIFLTLTGSLIVILFFLFFYILDLLSNKPKIRAYCKETQNYLRANERPFSEIITKVFDNAKKCGNQTSCLQEISNEIFSTLPSRNIPLQLGESTYFVRISDEGLIEKMFLGGTYYAKTPETLREKFAMWHIKNDYRICDYGWKEDVTTQTMTYLRDITSEAEIIIPINAHGVKGAVVRLWGD